eukprot:SAG25_NODE_5632_length_636_cov_1.288641_1_plen_124_part_10
MISMSAPPAAGRPPDGGAAEGGSPSSPGGVRERIVLPAVRDRMERIYAAHNPRKLADCNALMREWQGDEEQLLVRLCGVPHPLCDIPFAWLTGSAPAWVRSTTSSRSIWTPRPFGRCGPSPRGC